MNDILAPVGDGTPTDRLAPVRPAAPVAIGAVAAFSVAAAAIHFSMVLPHLTDDAVLASAFIAVGWVQVGTAAAVVCRPSRHLLMGVAALNTGFVSAWATSRIGGLPFGPHPGTPEVASFVDLATAALEAGVVVVAVLLITRPGLGAERPLPAIVGAIPVVVALVFASVAMTSTSAKQHGSAGHGSPSDGTQDGGAGHPHGNTPVVEGVYTGADQTSHPHGGPTLSPLDMATQQLLSSQLTSARTQTSRYPTVADIKAAGGKALSVFTPSTGAHHTMPIEGAPVPTGGFDLQAIMGGVKEFDPNRPPIVLYSGMADTSVVVGIMYVAFSDTEPEGFAGPNDHWHRHAGVCAKVNNSGGLDVLLPIERDTTKEQCDAAGGNHLPVTPWMLHVWTAPGWESPAGVFSHENPLLVCRDGTAIETAANFAAGCRGLV